MAHNTIKCKHCPKIFVATKKTSLFCSTSCRTDFYYQQNKLHPFKRKATCKHCGGEVQFVKLKIHEKTCHKYNKTCKLCRKPYRADKTNVRNVFCGSSCAAIYNNSHKTHGVRRSKLEGYLEKKLKKQYPKLKFLFNKVEDFGFELDVYIPALSLAFEINGIVHYKNIYGPEKYERIKKSDRNKIVKCYERGIDLIVLDTLEQRNFSEESSARYLETIYTVINTALVKNKKPVKTKRPS